MLDLISVFFFLSQLLAVGVGFFLLKRFKRSIGAGLTLIFILYFIYNFFVPGVDVLLSINSFFGFRFTNNQILSFTQGSVYSFGLLSIVCGYCIFYSFTNFSRKENFDITLDFKNGIIYLLIIIQMLVWILVIVNIISSGISLVNIFDFSTSNEADLLFSTSWKYPFIDMLSNCLPVCLFLQFKFSKKINWILVFLFSFWLFISLLSGWRYRIILFFLFIVVDFLILKKWSFIRIFLGALFLSISLSWLTLNRMAIAKRQFHLITFDLSLFDVRIFATEFSNSRTFKATLIYLDSHPEIKALGPGSWLRFLENKGKPKRDFPNFERPKPWILEVTKVWIPPGWPWNPNPAVTQMEEFFLTFGWIGLLIGMFAVGFWVGFLDVLVKDPVFQSFKVVGIALLFQWTTRGFFLYQLQITIVCFLPFLLLWLAKPYLSHVSAANKA